MPYEYDVDFALCYLTTHPSDLVSQSVAYTSLRSPRCHAILTFSIDNSVELPGVAFSSRYRYKERTCENRYKHKLWTATPTHPRKCPGCLRWSKVRLFFFRCRKCVARCLCTTHKIAQCPGFFGERHPRSHSFSQFLLVKWMNDLDLAERLKCVG